MGFSDIPAELYQSLAVLFNIIITDNQSINQSINLKVATFTMSRFEIVPFLYDFSCNSFLFGEHDFSWLVYNDPFTTISIIYRQ